MEPTISQRLGTRLGVVMVTLHHVRASADHFAHFTGCQRAVVLASDEGMHKGRGRAHRTLLSHGITGIDHRDGRRGLGTAVKVNHPLDARKEFHNPLLGLRRQFVAARRDT